MTTTHSAAVAVLQVRDASVWHEGFSDEQAKKALGKRRVPGEILRHKTSALGRTRISSSPTTGSQSTPPTTLNRRPTPLHNSFEPPTPSLPPSQSLASFLSGQKGDEEEEERRVKREERFQAQRASLRPSRSITQFQTVQRSVSDTKGKEKNVVNSWRQGCIEMKAFGGGGVYGGSLHISGDGIAARQITLAPLHKLKSENTSSPVKDVRMLHHTLTSQMHVISLTLVLDVCTSTSSSERQLGQLPRSLHEEDAGYGGIVRRRPSAAGASSTLAAFGKRARGLTLAGTPEERKGSASSGSTFHGTETSVEQTFLLAFGSMTEQWEWYTLLLSLCPPSKAARQQRRLSVKILDLQERSTHGPGGYRGDEASVHLGPSIDTKSIRLRDGKEKVRPGWAQKERICCEVVLDGVAYGRTSWQGAEERSASPFWGESIDLDDLPDFCTCTVKLYKMHKHRPVPFATVDIPVMSSFLPQRDERYPIMAESTVIGELRLVAEYHDFVILPRENYADLKLTKCTDGLDLVYALASKGALDGMSDLLVRIGIAGGTLLDWLQEMCRFEAQASGETLFRGNTLLSKTLEATMRSFCFDFLVRSIGPTIERVLTENLALSLHVTTQANGVVVLQDESLEAMRELVRDCWNDMYHARDTFPEFVRHVLFQLFKAVKEHHAADEEKLKFKAVSSFLFLRLIGPALMRPHLFGLADGMPSPGVRKTLTLLAKVLHALAFFTEKDGRDPELACFTQFIKDNSEAMIDYLSSLTTPLDSTYRSPPLSPIGNLIAERVARAPAHLGERTPILTASGPLDLSADLSVLFYTLREREQSALLVATAESPVVPTRAEQELNDTLDAIAENIEVARMRKLSLASSHRGSESMSTSTGTNDTGYVTARGRPSLSLSIDSHGTPPMPSRPLDPEVRRKSSAASASHRTPRLAVQTPLTGSTAPSSIQTPLSQSTRGPTSPVVPSSPTSPRSPLLGATASFRNKLSASASWRWLSFGGAATNPNPAVVDEGKHRRELAPDGPPNTASSGRTDASPGSSRTRVSIQPSAPVDHRTTDESSPVRKARSASAAPTRHARSGSTSLPVSPALPRGQSYTSSSSHSSFSKNTNGLRINTNGDSYNSSRGNGSSVGNGNSIAAAVASRSSSLAYRQHSYPLYNGRPATAAAATQHSYTHPVSTPTPLYRPATGKFPELGPVYSPTAPRERQSVAPPVLARAAEMEDADRARNGSKVPAMVMVKPKKPDRPRDRPSTATATGVAGKGMGLDAELGEVTEKRKGRLGRSGTVGGSGRSR